MRAYLGAVCLGCAVFYASVSWAATIEPVQGNLSVNQAGQGFHPISGRVDANVGDSVMVSPDGAATVVYDDGCKVNVQPGAVATISPLSPCASGSNADDSSNWGAWVIGAGAAAALGLAIYEATKTSSSSPTVPVSP